MRGEFVPYAYADNVLTPDECHQLTQNGTWIDPTFGGDRAHTPQHKPCAYYRLARNAPGLIYGRVVDAIDYLNRTFLHFDWDRHVEDIQVSRYQNGAEHPWHIDWGEKEFYYRKINVSVGLDDGYEGGELQLGIETSPVTVPLPPGRLVAFSTQFAHRVTPVTSGTRTVLVTWGHGPCWR